MSSQDPYPYTDPATGLLRNKLGITTAAELDRVEAEVTSLRLVQLREHDLPGDYDLAHLQAFHLDDVELGPRTHLKTNADTTADPETGGHRLRPQRRRRFSRAWS